MGYTLMHSAEVSINFIAKHGSKNQANPLECYKQKDKVVSLAATNKLNYRIEGGTALFFDIEAFSKLKDLMLEQTKSQGQTSVAAANNYGPPPAYSYLDPLASASSSVTPKREKTVASSGVAAGASDAGSTTTASPHQPNASALDKGKGKAADQTLP